MEEWERGDKIITIQGQCRIFITNNLHVYSSYVDETNNVNMFGFVTQNMAKTVCNTYRLIQY